MDDKLFTLSEVSKYLKIPKSTIYKLSQKKELPSVKIGKQLRFRKSSLGKWFAEKEKGAVGSTQQTLPVYSKSGAASPKSKQVLLIDDDPLVLKAVSKLLESHGYQVELAASGEEALSKIKKTHFDLLVTDIRMPGMDGIETIKRIRELNAGSGRTAVPEIIITGYIDTRAQQEAAGLGIADYLYKPFAIADFIEAVNKKSGVVPSLN